MAEMTTLGYANLITKLRLADPSQVDECRHQMASDDPEEFLRLMERKGYLTALQIDKIRKGDSSGYFLRNYRILYKIASGSFGRVFRAEDPQTGRVVAIKVLRRRWSDDKANIELFEREGRVGMTLRHPGIVEILETGRDPNTGQYFITMEFVEGGSLRDLLAIRKKFEPQEGLKIMENLASALAYAYAHGVTHRDIKLTNILISSTGEAKLVDFGLAQIYASRSRMMRISDEDEDMHVQRTVDYAGLEKATHVKLNDVRTDIFFLGCVFYEMLTGRSPLPMSRDRVARSNPRRFENITPIKPEEVHNHANVIRVVETMMALDPARRYQTPAQLHDAIKQARAELEGGQGAGKAASGPTVFVVEKDERAQNTIRDKLKELGYRVLIAKDPARALDRFYTQPFQGLIVDAETTEKEGIDMFRDICERARSRNMTFGGILLLGEEQKHVADMLPPNPLSVVLIRPIRFKALLGKLEELVPVPRAANADGKASEAAAS